MAWGYYAQMVDTKPFSFANRDRGGMIHAGEPLHDMKVRLTLDDRLRIHAAEAVTDGAPYHYCVEINAAYQQLVGLSIGPGWNQKLKETFSGTRGCTHITELLGPMATTAYQAIFGSEQMRQRREQEAREGRQNPRENYLNTCHALSTSGPVVKMHWPQAYKAKT
ncbi:MAG: DUF2889 domain-containing protein [Thiolinea sp.]